MRRTHAGMRRAGNRCGGTVTLAQLSSFLTLARLGKQAAAQAALGKSQSQISRDLAALERATGMPLVDRRGRRLTPAGQRLLDYAEEVLRGWEYLGAASAGEGGDASGVVLAAEPEAIAGALVPLLAAVRRRRPGLQVRLLARPAGELGGLLAAGAADIVVLPEGADATAGVSTRPFLAARVMVALPASWAAARRRLIGPAALRGRTLLVPGPGSSLRSAVDAALAAAGLRRPNLCEVGPGRDAVLSATAAGLGAGFLLDFDGVARAIPAPVPAGAVLLPAGPEFGPVRYRLAIRKTLKAAGPAGLLVRELLRARRGHPL